MEYRGSKSVFISNAVKEQRVDGSWLLNKLAVLIRSLRCTLMVFERNYQIKILSKQLNKKKPEVVILSTLVPNSKLNPAPSVCNWVFLWRSIDTCGGCFNLYR